MARDLDAIARLWDADRRVRRRASCSTPATPGPPAGTSRTAVDDVRAITGRIDLVHLNNSRDPHGSSRDRHAPLTDGEIPTELLVEVARAADCPVVLETPGDAAAHAEEIAAAARAPLAG